MVIIASMRLHRELILNVVSPGTSEFIAQQMEIIQQMQAEQERRAHELGARRLQRPKSRIEPEIPPVPALP
jgi:hypothetical protein